MTLNVTCRSCYESLIYFFKAHMLSSEILWKLDLETDQEWESWQDKKGTVTVGSKGRQTL